jgi:C4-dicarboxylate-specific signal transduction histidine kinase
MQAAIAESAQNLTFWDQTWRIRNKKGKIKWLNGRGMPKRLDDGSTVWNTLILDVTPLKQTQRKIRKLNEKLEKRVEERTKELASTNQTLMAKAKELECTNKKLEKTLNELKVAQVQLIRSEKMVSLGTLTAGMAHEINNPLNYIKGGVHSITQHLSESEDLDEDLRQMLTTLDEGVQRVANIVRNLKHFGPGNKEDEPCEVNVILNNCITLLGPSMTSAPRVFYDLQNEPLTIIANEGKMHQLFLNLLRNAFEAVDASGQIKIKSCIKHNHAVITIQDNGKGIPEEIMEKVMDPFFTTKEPGKGPGLGLSIAYAIIKEHEGSIHIDSKPGKGTSVEVELPLTSEPA